VQTKLGGVVMGDLRYLGQVAMTGRAAVFLYFVGDRGEKGWEGALRGREDGGACWIEPRRGWN